MKKIKALLKKSRVIIIYNKLLGVFYSIKFNIKKNEILQLASTTGLDRHPDLFLLCQQIFGKYSEIRILSFGCSTGEECFTLKQYFPNAFIVGCDINKDSLIKANSKNKDAKISFVFSSEENLNRLENFNIIFANSVLCKQPECMFMNNLSNIFPFNVYFEIMKRIDSILIVGGLFVTRYSNYRFEETELISKYECLYFKDTDFPTFDSSGYKNLNNTKVCEVFKKIL